MIRLEDLVEAAMSAPPERKLEALRILRGEPPASLALSDASASPEPYLTLREVAKRLSLNPSTLWRWRIPGHQFGGSRRYRMTEVMAHIESQEFKRRMAALRATRETARQGA